ncbi:MAG: acetate uptake transporter [Bacteroidales bacterium]
MILLYYLRRLFNKNFENGEKNGKSCSGRSCGFRFNNFVVAMGFIFGGLAQMIAGFQEQKLGNNFGYSAFTAYGSFWIGLGIIWMLNHFEIYQSSTLPPANAFPKLSLAN